MDTARSFTFFYSISVLLLAPVAAFAVALSMSLYLPISMENKIFFSGIAMPVLWVSTLLWGFSAHSTGKALLGIFAVALACIGSILIGMEF